MNNRIQKFQPYAEVLRALGNFRHSYVIIATEAVIDKPTALVDLQNVSIKYVYEHDTKHADIIDFDEQIIVYVISNVETILSKPEILLYANEVQMSTLEYNSIGLNYSLSGFKLVRNEDNVTVLNKRVLTYEHAIALKAPKRFKLRDVHAEPFHVIMYDTNKNIAMTVIWDTREVIEIETDITQKLHEELMQLKHVNDSSRLLYMWSNVFDSIESEDIRNYLTQHYLINIIDGY